MHGIIHNNALMLAGAAIAAGASIDNNSSIIDMADYESVMFVALIDGSAATGVATLKIEVSDTAADAGMTAVVNAVATITSAATDDIKGKVLVVEIRKPPKRYVQAVRTSATANIAFGDLIAVLKPLRRPADQGSTVAKTAYVSG